MTAGTLPFTPAAALRPGFGRMRVLGDGERRALAALPEVVQVTMGEREEVWEGGLFAAWLRAKLERGAARIVAEAAGLLRVQVDGLGEYVALLGAVEVAPARAAGAGHGAPAALSFFAGQPKGRKRFTGGLTHVQASARD